MKALGDVVGVGDGLGVGEGVGVGVGVGEAEFAKNETLQAAVIVPVV